MASYHFSFLISAPNVEWDAATEAFGEAGCGDAIFRLSGNAYELEFYREAPSLRVAVLSAIENVKSANVGVEILCMRKPLPKGAKKMRVPKRLYVLIVNGPMGRHLVDALGEVDDPATIAPWTSLAAADEEARECRGPETSVQMLTYELKEAVN